MLRSSLLVTAALGAAVALLAAGAGAAAPADPGLHQAVPSASAPAQSASQFPVTIRTPSGTVTVRSKPRRIVSLSPTATETLFAVGAGPQVVAVDDQSDHPRSAPRTSLSGFTPNVEAIAAYRPDLVVIAFDTKGLASALRSLRIAVVHHDGAKTIAGAYQQIRQLGLVTGNGPQATRVVRSMKSRINRILRASRARARGLDVFHELSPDLYSVTSSTFIGKVYAQLGLENIADAADSSGTGYPQLSAEYVVAASPDLIVLADSVCCGQNAATVAARPGWDRISAVRTGSIVRVHDSIASRWGPRLVDFFRAMSSALARLGQR